MYGDSKNAKIMRNDGEIRRVVIYNEKLRKI